MEIVTSPFRHCVGEDFFTPRRLAMIKDFAQRANWDFFEHERFPQYISRRSEVERLFLTDSATSRELSNLLSGDFISGLGRLATEQIDECLNISLHKLTKGCFNGVHNDANQYGEKVRLVCYLSESSDYDGGELQLYDLAVSDRPAISYKFPANTAFLFAMNESAVHSVNEVRSGERICLVLTYGRLLS